MCLIVLLKICSQLYEFQDFNELYRLVNSCNVSDSSIPLRGFIYLYKALRLGLGVLIL